jgi:hypothetical protein
MQKVIKDLEQAREILADTKGAEWGGAIQHPEPQVIVACAWVVEEAARAVDQLVSNVESLQGQINELERRAKRGGGW